MTQRYRKTVTIVWLALCALSIGALFVGTDAASISARYASYSAVAVLAISLFKVRLVILHFMEVAHAPLPLRLVFEGWLLCAMIGFTVLFYLDRIAAYLA